MATSTRRQRHRAATTEEIKQAALDQLASYGASGLTLRGVARAIGMSPAGIYRYFEGLDGLITQLITDAYSDLADAVAEAASAADTRGRAKDPRTRLRNGMLAYREWCVAHPNRFLLIFGTPIPGYVAPEAGPTVDASRRMGAAFFAVSAEAWNQGVLRSSPALRTPGDTERRLAEELAPGFPPEAIARLLGAWSHFHGMVTLEVLHQFDWIFPDPEAFYVEQVEAILDLLLVSDAGD